MSRVADRGLEHVAEPPGAELAQHQEPAVERAGDNRRKQTRAGNEVEPERAKVIGRRGGGRGPLSADHDDVAAFGAVHDRGKIPSRPVQVRLDDLQRESGCCGRVERVAAALEHRHADRGCEPVRRRDHPEGSAQLGPSREEHGKRL